MNKIELRLGSIISTSYMTSGLFKVEKLMRNKCHFCRIFEENIKSDTTYTYIEPVLLTKEWLLKFGFKLNDCKGWCSSCDNTHEVYELNSVDIAIEDNKFKLWIELEDVYYNHSIIEVKSIHQLQNLYFALTGKELTLRNDNCKNLKISEL